MYFFSDNRIYTTSAVKNGIILYYQPFFLIK